MKLAKVIGTVVATAKYETLKSEKILMIQPLNDDLTKQGGAIAAMDTIQAGPADLVYWVLSREAALALPHNYSPIDAAIVGIVDQINSEKTPIRNKKRIFVKE
ncbi:MAG: EutN/CcmL family microcompartment protein [Bdellovibrionales bacterium]|jgi:ethanolamine utilization protein EutN|nr:EutN/CcmL family microcompartment protein [Bdellovibrionales bacterium]MBT3527219.1 EutN/CcmL family microcompartment protein [Bdellovibrionales bacterium]MBT7768284.1 EutN/CcmL family microcompartment protein [Bdellovibrionales bacterium]